MVKPIMRDVLFLGQKSVPATEEDLQVGRDLQDTLAANREACVGMAANMIGVKKRIIIVNAGFRDIIMFNPVIVRKSGMRRHGGKYDRREKTHHHRKRRIPRHHHVQPGDSPQKGMRRHGGKYDRREKTHHHRKRRIPRHHHVQPGDRPQKRPLRNRRRLPFPARRAENKAVPEHRNRILRLELEKTTPEIHRLASPDLPA